MLERLDIKHGPIKRFNGSCGSAYWVTDILRESDMTMIKLSVDKPNMYRIISPHEGLYKMYDDPHYAAMHDPDVDDDLLDDDKDGDED
jgi:hypothetical protein